MSGISLQQKHGVELTNLNIDSRKHDVYSHLIIKGWQFWDKTNTHRESLITLLEMQMVVMS